jgi:Flp pilus assembly protein TadG
MKQRYRILRDTGGASAVEFALTVPVFIALLFGIVEAGMAVWTQFGLQYGVEAAARCAVVNPTTCGSASDIAAYAANNALGLSIPTSSYTVTNASCGNQVQASFAYSFFTPFFGLPHVTLTAQSCFPK